MQIDLLMFSPDYRLVLTQSQLNSDYNSSRCIIGWPEVGLIVRVDGNNRLIMPPGNEVVANWSLAQTHVVNKGN